MVEATTGFRLDPTSILDVYKVLWYLGMLCMGIWDHPYSDTPLQVAGGFWDYGGRPESPCDVVMSLLRLHQASDWIPHPYWMYTKCCGTLICCVWAYGATLTVIRLCRLGMDFGFWG